MLSSLAISIGVCLLVAALSYAVDEKFRPIAAICFLIVFSLVASLIEGGRFEASSEENSKYFFLIYAASVGMLIDISKVSGLAVNELAFAIILLASSFMVLAFSVKLFRLKSDIAVLIVSSSVLSPVVAAMVVGRVLGKSYLAKEPSSIHFRSCDGQLLHFIS